MVAVATIATMTVAVLGHIGVASVTALARLAPTGRMAWRIIDGMIADAVVKLFGVTP